MSIYSARIESKNLKIFPPWKQNIFSSNFALDSMHRNILPMFAVSICIGKVFLEDLLFLHQSKIQQTDKPIFVGVVDWVNFLGFVGGVNLQRSMLRIVVFLLGYVDQSNFHLLLQCHKKHFDLSTPNVGSIKGDQSRSDPLAIRLNNNVNVYDSSFL